jgi:hypothetical protein
VSPHTLRHTAITWAAQAGVPFFDIAAYFGVSARIIESVYAHHHPDAGKSVHRAHPQCGQTGPFGHIRASMASRATLSRRI